jgi:thiamine pyrophosphokinase
VANKTASILAGVISVADIPQLKGDLIGVDYGALFALNHQLPLVFAIGDFDSVSKNDFAQIQARTKDIIQALPNKDQSDTELAIVEAIKRGYQHIFVFGVIGTRLDHFYVVFRLLSLFKDTKITIENSTNKISLLKQGTHKLKIEHQYFSLFAYESAIITIKGSKYDVEDRRLDIIDRYGLSNEALLSEVIVTVSSGIVFLFESSDGG